MTNKIITDWQNAYYNYLLVYEPEMADEEKESRWIEKTNGMIELYNSNPNLWSGNIAVMLKVTTDEYERLTENLIYRGYTENPEKTRWIP